MKRSEFLKEVKKFYEEKKYPRLKSIFETGMGKIHLPKSPEALRILGEMYYYGYNYPKKEDKAEKYFEESYELDNKDPKTSYFLSLIYKPKDLEKSYKFLKYAVDKNVPEALLEVAYTWIEKDNIPKAKEILLKLTKTDFKPAWIKLAEIYMKENQPEKSKEILEKLTQNSLNYDNYKAKILLAEYYMKEEKSLEKSIQCYKEVLKFLFENNLKEEKLLHEKAGITFYEANILSQAKYHLEKAEVNKETLYYLGMIYYKYGMHEKAKDYLLKSNELGNTKSLEILNVNKLLEDEEVEEKEIETTIPNGNDSFDEKIDECLKNNLFLSLFKVGKELFEKKDPRALNIFLICSQKEMELSFYYLGEIYLNGIGCEKNFRKSIFYFEKILKIIKISYDQEINAISDQVILSLGFAYFYEKEYSKVLDTFEVIQHKNDPFVIEILGIISLKGLGGKCNYYRAKDSFLRSVGLGNMRVKNYLAEIYYNGLGVERNLKNVKEILESIPHNELQFSSLYYLGQIYKDIDVEKSKQYFEEVLSFKTLPKTSNPFSRSGLIVYHTKYTQGIDFTPPYFLSLGELGVIKKNQGNIKEAIFLLSQSADFGSSDAMYELGKIYLHEKDVLEGFKNLSLHYLERAFEKGVKEAAVEIGNIYSKGLLGELDEKKANYFYSMAPSPKTIHFKVDPSKNQSNEPKIEKDLESNFNLGVMYFNGKGIEKNLKLSLQYLHKSIEYNPTLVYNYLGEIHLELKEYNSAKSYFELSGSPESLKNLGIMYLNVKNVNYEKAILYFEKSKQLGNKISSMYLGNIYFQGLGVEKDYKKAFEYYSSNDLNDVVSLFDGESLNNFGELYLKGKGTEINYRIAKILFEMAIEKNDKLSLINLASLYFYGYGVDINYTKARELYENGKLNLDSESLNNLAKMYFEGLGGKKDFYAARILLEKGLKHLNNENLMRLSQMYLQGLGGDKETLDANKIIESGVQEGNLFIYLQLGKFYYYGTTEHSLDWNKAKECLEKSYTILDGDGLHCLGSIYFHEFDYVRAKVLFEKSLEFGKVESLYFLGLMYFRGLNVDLDYSKAKIFFEKNISLNTDYSNQSFNVIGKMYLFGLGVSRNFYLAMHYFKKDTTGKSNNHIGYCYFNGFGVKKDLREATLYFQSVKSSFNLNNLGYMNLKGIGIEYNIERAIGLFEMAIKKGNIYSMINLAYIYCLKNNYEKSRSYLEAVNINELDEVEYMTSLSILDENNALEIFEKSFDIEIDLLRNINNEKLEENIKFETMKGYRFKSIKYEFPIQKKIIFALLKNVKKLK